MPRFKYNPLFDFLQSQRDHRITVSFSQVEGVLGFKLPATAYTDNAWWSNNASGHSQARAWLDAGWKTREVNRKEHRLVFERAGASAVAADRWSKIYGSMKGMITLAPGVDLTDPPMPELADYLDEKYGSEPRRRGAGK